MQGLRGQGIAVDIEPARKFGCQVLCIRRATAIAAEVKMFPFPEPVDYEDHDISYFSDKPFVLQDVGLDGKGFTNDLFYFIVHGCKYPINSPSFSTPPASRRR